MHVQLLAETRLFSSRREIGFNVVRNDAESDVETSSIHTDLGDFGEDETYQDEIDRISYWDRVLQLWRVKRVRRSALASFAVMSTFYYDTESFTLTVASFPATLRYQCTR